MVRGCQKKIIYLKNTGSEVFDEAYFVISDKELSSGMDECDMVEEANRILNESISVRQKDGWFCCFKRKVKERIPMFIIGFTVGVIITLLIK